MTTPLPAQEPLIEIDAELLERLMKRTKTGAEIGGRELAAKAGLASGTISNVLTRRRLRLQASTVAAICDVIGVELLVLGTPVDRLNPAADAVAALVAA